MGYVFLTTSDIQTTWPEQRQEANIRSKARDSNGHATYFYTKGRLEAAFEAGHVPVVLTSRSKLCPTDEWWLKLMEAAHGAKVLSYVHLPDFSVQGAQDVTSFYKRVVEKVYGLSWPQEEDRQGESRDVPWMYGLSALNLRLEE